MKPEGKIKIILNIQGPDDLIPTYILGEKILSLCNLNNIEVKHK